MLVLEGPGEVSTLVPNVLLRYRTRLHTLAMELSPGSIKAVISKVKFVSVGLFFSVVRFK